MFCITLKESRRRKDVIRELSRVGLHSVVVVERDRDISDGKRGCFESHQFVLRKGLQLGSRTVTVFEDDVIFRMRCHNLDVPSLVSRASRVAEDNPNCIVGLGGFVVGKMGEPMEDKLFRLADFALTHAYVVSSHAAEMISSIEYTQKHIDKVYLESFRNNMIMLTPSIAFQRGYMSPYELTTTERTMSYFFITILRNIISSFIIQVFLEYIARLRALL